MSYQVHLDSSVLIALPFDKYELDRVYKRLEDAGFGMEVSDWKRGNPSVLEVYALPRVSERDGLMGIETQLKVLAEAVVLADADAVGRIISATDEYERQVSVVV